MAHTVESVYRDLKKEVTHKRLKELSVDIIGSYKSRDRRGLLWYASLLGIDRSGEDYSRLFARIIQHYHPDKLARILAMVDEHHAGKNLEELLKLRRTYVFDQAARKAYERTIEEDRYSFDMEDFEPVRRHTHEESGYDHVFDPDEEEEKHEDYDEYDGYDIKEDEEEADDEESLEDDEEEEDAYEDEEYEEDYGFIEAVNQLFYGNLDLEYTLNPDDLHRLYGELDLSCSDIGDVRGIEHCINISSLNLSGNHLGKIGSISRLTQLESLFLAENELESIEGLAGLDNLRELDISFNRIDDLAVLLTLPELVYVNALGNPLKNKKVLDELSEKGVIVVV